MVRGRVRLGFLATLLLAFGLRVYRLGVDSLWYDETVSALLARKSLAAMWAHTARDIHPPLYYALLHFWQMATGGSEYSLAFFSVWFGVAGVALAGYLAERLFGWRVGLLAALLMAFHPFSIWYAQEVRMYTLGVFLLLLALKFTLDFWKRGDWLPLLGYALTAGALLWTLYYSAFALLALNLVVIPWLLVKARRRLLPWLIAQTVAILLYLPWLPHALRQALNPPVPPWREPLPLVVLLAKLGMEGATALTQGQSVAPGTWWVLGAAALVVALLAFRATTNPRCRLPNPWAAGLLWATLAGPVAIIVIFSQLVTPLYHVRYLQLYSGAFPILLAAGLVWLARGNGNNAGEEPEPGRAGWRFFLGGLMFFLIIAGSLVSLKHYHTRRFEYEAADDLRGAVAAIHARLGPRDAVLIDAGYLYPAFVTYWPEPIGWMGRLSEYPPSPDQVGEGALVVLAGFVDGDPDIGWGDPASDFYAISREETEARLQTLFETTNTVWLLRGYDTVNDPEGIIRAWVEVHGQLLYDQVYLGLTYVRVQGWRTAPVRDGSPLLPPQHPLTAAFRDGMRLIGFDMRPDPPRAGEPLRLTLYWKAAAAPSRSYKAFVHWLDGSWRLLAQDDELPGFGALPTDGWRPGQVVESNFVLTPPAALPPDAFLITGFYDPASGQRLPLISGEGQVVLLGDGP